MIWPEDVTVRAGLGREGLSDADSLYFIRALGRVLVTARLDRQTPSELPPDVGQLHQDYPYSQGMSQYLAVNAIADVIPLLPRGKRRTSY